MKLYIKNMVCNRCIIVVSQEFEKAGVKPVEVIMGKVELSDPLSDSQLKNVRSKLIGLGFEILDDKARKLIERIKHLLIEKIQKRKFRRAF